ncbi:enolase C-terminal domain-like protein [Blastochloris sulfoviridis]|uniref:O-succinylbenzoate synthase n=1 Tax=Blastochloris sulfoviridis TaxID=50712 RepID=A0A5M6HNP6_9HYPH|nr:enolase C-terminal domain-like protein [Blastochloris sulfoviridis]KAA5597219.1 O-succinylbenzoate synthase [Blastochloris sulfoviridis]
MGVLVLDVTPPRRRPAGTLTVRGVARPREAVRIALCDRDGLTGQGEALPLPGFSRDNAEDAASALEAVAARAASAGGLAVPETGAPAERIAAALVPFDALLAPSPSARFALESALLDVLSRRAGLSAAAWLAHGRARSRVPVSVLLPDDDTAIDAAAEATARGHGVLKLKIALAGRSASEEDAHIAAIRAAVEAVRPGSVRLRLDANGAFSPAEVAARLAALARFGVEIVEEPCAGPALLALPALPLPWAADESLADPAMAEQLLNLPPGRGPAALVLKPALLGLRRCLELADAGAARGRGLIVTHAFDGDLGFAAACALAAALPAPPWPCGLAPHAGLCHPWPSGPMLPEPSMIGLASPGVEAAP